MWLVLVLTMVPGQVSAAGSVDDILAAKNWTSAAIVWSHTVPLTVVSIATVEKSAGPGARGVFIRRENGGPRIYVAAGSWYETAVEHEYQHAWDFEHDKRDWEMVPTDLATLAHEPGRAGAAAWSLLQSGAYYESGTFWHANHKLKDLLASDMEGVPEWYRQKYFGFLPIHRVVYVGLVG